MDGHWAAAGGRPVSGPLGGDDAMTVATESTTFEGVPASGRAVLSVRGVAKSFTGVPVLSDIDLDIYPGQILGLIGQNGAGKSTLVKIISGAEHPTAGHMVLDGQPVRFHQPHDAQAVGISTIYQELSLVPTLSVAENVYLANLPSRCGRVDWAQLKRSARASLSSLGFELDVDRAVANLPIAARQVVEIAKATHQKAKVILLDEPTATLPKPDIGKLFSILRQLCSSGVAIIYVSHRIDEVYELCDHVAILRDGWLVAFAVTSELPPEDAVKLMLGDRLSALVRESGSMQRRRINPAPPGREAATVLEVRGLSAGHTLDRISLELKVGEVVAVTGLVGSGQSELGACLFGYQRRSEGEILVRGTHADVKSPRSAMRAGLGCVPEDRKYQGLVLGMSVNSNLTLSSLDQVASAGVLSSWAERRNAGRLIAKLGIKMRSASQEVGSLSGGNQQKVVLGKWLLAGSTVLIACEPTRGVDVGAKEDIYNQISEFVTTGGSVLVITSELEEALMCDRIYVLARGRIVAQFQHGEIELDQLLSILR